MAAQNVKISGEILKYFAAFSKAHLKTHSGKKFKDVKIFEILKYFGPHSQTLIKSSQKLHQGKDVQMQKANHQRGVLQIFSPYLRTYQTYLF